MINIIIVVELKFTVDVGPLHAHVHAVSLPFSFCSPNGITGFNYVIFILKK